MVFRAAFAAFAAALLFSAAASAAESTAITLSDIQAVQLLIQTGHTTDDSIDCDHQRIIDNLSVVRRYLHSNLLLGLSPLITLV